MSDEEDEIRRKRIPVGDLRSEPGSEDLLDSPSMEPYTRFAIAMASGQDLSEALKAIGALRLESRYVWRVASAIKWAFADFDTLNVVADRNTSSPEDRRRIAELLHHRPLQFCLFLSDLFGQGAMEVLMVSAIKQARAIQKLSDSENNPPTG